MKYYSEILDEMFSTVSELNQAEYKVKKAEEEKKREMRTKRIEEINAEYKPKIQEVLNFYNKCLEDAVEAYKKALDLDDERVEKIRNI